jgi:hypothetical protein
MRSRFHTEYPQFWSYLQTLLLSGAFCWAHVNWHSIVCKENNWSNCAENIGYRPNKFAGYCELQWYIVRSSVCRAKSAYLCKTDIYIRTTKFRL